MRDFVESFQDLYGESSLVYNVHSLLHLPRFAQIYGCLDKFSCFPFENYLKQLKSMIKKPGLPLEQVVRRIYERRVWQPKSRETDLKPFCKKQLSRGPVPRSYSNYIQYEEYHVRTYVLSRKQGDNAVLIHDDYFIVKNILSVDKDVRIICQKFKSKQSFFDYPVDSLQLLIAYVEDLSSTFWDFSVTEVECKVVLMPHLNGYVGLPLIHSTSHCTRLNVSLLATQDHGSTNLRMTAPPDLCC
jgi:hypothetical protein